MRIHFLSLPPSAAPALTLPGVAGASAIAYTSIVSVIFLARYLDVIRYTFKLTWMALGVTVLAEVAGKAILSQGLTTQLRPRKYFTVPRETLDAVIGDVHELINFFVIEAQRIFFAAYVLAAAVGRLPSSPCLPYPSPC